MCELCKGNGWYVRDVKLGHPDFGRAITCTCQEDKRKAAMQRKLETLDGLTRREREHTFETIETVGAQERAVAILRDALNGIFVLHGNPGAGKSHLLHCTVNQARAFGRVAVYTTTTDLLDYLRATFNPRHEEVFEERWAMLISCEVLCIDELDEFSATDWAKERFLRLIDERWRKRDDLLTVVALNTDPDLMLPKVASRLIQGRVLRLKTSDMRRVFTDFEPA